MSAIALLIALLLNAGIAPAVAQEDDALVPVMGQVAIGALNEAHPECSATRWDFNRDASNGLTVTAHGQCEFAAEFYRNPDTLDWQFAVEGS